MSNPKPNTPAKRPGLFAVAKLIFLGLVMIGKNSTWEKDGIGARATPKQIIAGAVIGGLIVVALLVLIAQLAVRFAAG